MFDRRAVLGGSLALAVAACAAGGEDAPRKADLSDALRRVEDAAGGRLGAFVLDPVRGQGSGWRSDERFAHCSSFKLSLAAMVLAKSGKGEADLAEVLRWTHADLLPMSPVTSASRNMALPVEELARATLVTSDNTAANVLLSRFGGPQELTRFWRSLGDRVSRLDRYEPQLNEVPHGTELDTTTPRAMARTVAALLLGDTLSEDSRITLRSWMIDVKTGLERIRAGLPGDWITGDKTGTGIGDERHTYVDLAFGGPAGRRPLIVAAYFEPARLVEPMDPLALRVLADVGRAAAASIAGGLAGIGW